MLYCPFCYPQIHCFSGAWKFPLMSGNIFSANSLSDSLIAMLVSSCILYGYSGEMRILSGSSSIGRSPFPNLRRHLSKCCWDWSWLILMFSLSSMTVKNLQRGLFIIDAAVMWALDPLGMTIYIYIDAAVMWALDPLGMTMYIYIY